MDEPPSLSPQEGPSTRAQELLARCLELPTEAQDQAIEQLCQEHPDLADTLRKAYAFVREAGLIGDPEFPALEEDPAAQPGNDTIEIEGLRILKKLGSGGMGDVWLAEQLQPVRRKVAVKLVQRGTASHRILARFEIERQALARMSHPCIAHVFGAGVTRSGASYFLMEYVPGVPIHDYCDRKYLSIDERLDLFTQVCEGVQHAHQRGIIHRDLKPSNVLVIEHQGKAIPKIIDFGVAKATVKKLSGETVHTEHGVVIGTLEYMSPEQAAGDPNDIDTRTDVYALGVMLYELLSGSLPFDSKELRRHRLLEIAKILRDTPPPKPSTRLSRPQDDAAKLARHRRTKPSSLARKIRGDLDWITMMAMEKDRERRYESPAALAADIQRFRKHEPVVAGPPSALYRLRKLIRRNKTLFGAASVTLFVLVGGAIGTGYGLWSSIKANKKLQIEQSRTKVALGRAKEVSRVTRNMLRSVSPETAKGFDVTLLKIMLEKTSTRLLAGEIKDEMVALDLHSVISDSYHSIGLYTEAERHCLEALRIAERRFAPEDSRRLRQLRWLGHLQSAQGRNAEAAILLDRAVQLAEHVHGLEHRATLETMRWKADNLADLGDKVAAKELYERILKVMPGVLGPKDNLTLGTMEQLALIAINRGHYEEARQRLEEVLRAWEEDDVEKCFTMLNLAKIYERQGLHGKAVDQFEKAHQEFVRLLGPGHRDTLTAKLDLAALLCVRNEHRNYARAETLCQEVVRERRKRFDPDHPALLSALAALANVYCENRSPDKAVPLYRQVLAGFQKRFGEGHVDTIKTTMNLAQTLAKNPRGVQEALDLYEHALLLCAQAKGREMELLALSIKGLQAEAFARQRRFREAEKLYLEVLAGETTALGEDGTKTLITMDQLAGLYARCGRIQDAAKVYEKALSLRKAKLGEDSDEALGTMDRLAVLYERCGRLDLAQKHWETALSIRQAKHGKKSLATARGMVGLAGTYMRQRRFEEAEPLATKAVEIHLENLTPDHPDTLTAMGSLAMIYHNWGKLPEARHWYEKTIAGRTTRLGMDNLKTAIMQNNLAPILIEQGDPERARIMLEPALSVMRRKLSPAHKWTLDCATTLAGVYDALGRHDLALPLHREVLGHRVNAAKMPSASAQVLNGAAWSLLSHPIMQLRDTKTALSLALRAAEASGWREPNTLDTLALAYFETGDAEEAIKTQRRAIGLLKADDSRRRKDFEKRLKRYEERSIR